MIGPRRLTVLPVLLCAVILLSGCGRTYDQLVTGTFGKGKLVALAWGRGGTNTALEWAIDAYADVPPGTEAVFTMSGPQQWTCNEVFRTPQYVPATGGMFESDQEKLQDRVVVLPTFAAVIIGPGGDWQLTIEIPSLGVRFSHTWNLGYGDSPDLLYSLDPRCGQIAGSLAQQRGFVHRYLLDLQRLVSASPMQSAPANAQLSTLLDQATAAKTRGDGEPVSDRREADYRSAAASLRAIARLASAGGVAPAEAFRIVGYANSAAALLEQIGLG
jgi:hypothetical protein